MPTSQQRPATSEKNRNAQQSHSWLRLPAAGNLSRGLLSRIFRRLIGTNAYRTGSAPTEVQRNLVLTGLILGFLSIFTAIFPPCGLPIAVTGLLFGLYGRRTTPLYRMSTWAIALALLGLLLTLIYSVVTISIYISTQLFTRAL